MSSFRCLLTIDGREYPVTRCDYEFTQAATPLGRAAAKVRSGLLHLHLAVPLDDKLVAWAFDLHQKQSGQLLFHQLNSPVPSEVLQFEEAFCVGYEEVFEAGSEADGSYRCALRIAAGKLVLDTVAKDSYWAQTR